MTGLREAAQMALEALEYAEQNHGGDDCYFDAIEALRTALAQPEQEPVTMVISKTGDSSVTMSWWHEPALPVGTPLYTAPPQREWVGLTEEEVNEYKGRVGLYFVRKIEAKLKEKNNAL